MKNTIVFLLIALPAILFGQETKKVIEEHKNPWFKEVYYVLKSNNLIRHGRYQKLGYKDVVLMNGIYKNGLKDGTWTEFSVSGKNKKLEEYYSAGKEVGVWNYYDLKGDLEEKWDKATNIVTVIKYEDNWRNKEYKVIEGADTIISKLNSPPKYRGGKAMMYKAIYENIKYPQSAKEHGISGNVYITFTINVLTGTSGHRVTKGIGYGCDEEALRVVKLIPDAWFPGLLNNKLVSVEYVLPISFSIH